MKKDTGKRSLSDTLMKVATDRIGGKRLLLVYGGGVVLAALWITGIIIFNGIGTTPFIIFAATMGALSFAYVSYFFLGKHMRIALAATFIVFGLAWGVAATRGGERVEFDPIRGPERLPIRVITEREIPQPKSIEPDLPELPDLTNTPHGKPIPVPDADADVETYNPSLNVDMNLIDPDTNIVVTDPDNNVDPSDNYVYVEYSEAPKITKMVQPKYPDIARDMGIEGDVVLLVYIDETGTVRNALVQDSPGLPAMEEEAAKAAYKCKFAPARQQGKPVGVWYTIVMEFKR